MRGRLFVSVAFCAFLTSAPVLIPVVAQAKDFTTLHVFKGSRDGAEPSAVLIADADGNLYGTAPGGGRGKGCYGGPCGLVFKFAPDGTETVLYNFKGGSDGDTPVGGLIADKSGNLYGTTSGGGGVADCDGSGCGTVFKLKPDGTKTVLHAFTGGSDGANPEAGLTADKAGNLYGVTDYGGGSGCYGNGCGTVFKLAADGTETILHAFTGRRDGAFPYAALIVDKAGNLYGTTDEGGGKSCGGDGCGIVFKIAPDGTETVLHRFRGGSDGYNPRYASLLADQSGNLYGTTAYGGSTEYCGGYGCGTVFKLAPDGGETILYSFMSGNDGDEPFSGVIADGNGNLYGTTVVGGVADSGTIFKLAPDGTETVLHAFQGKGYQPYAGLAPVNGYFYGTTRLGAKKDDGTFYRFKY
jgi:uncharacterized repeat protein (TIGR03803 family)